jgi:hypothetical protein
MRCGDLLVYRGIWYYIGTKVTLKTREGNIVTATFLGNGRYEGEIMYYGYHGTCDAEKFIVGIVEPVYPPHKQEGEKSNTFFRTGSGSWNSDDDVFHGFLLYLAVMLGGIIFNDRWLIWIVATIIYFGWKAKK